MLYSMSDETARGIVGRMLGQDFPEFDALAQSESVLSADARLQLQRQYDRAKVELQRFTQDAQAEVQSTQEQTLHIFMQHLFPIVGKVASEKKLWAVFTVDSSTLWHDPSLDISDEIAKRLDSATPPDQKTR